MKIAFDVKGTLDGYNSVKVLALYRKFEAEGHEMFVWSNCYSYAIDIIEKLQLKATPLSKYSKYDAEENNDPIMDIAVEDDSSQTWLAANKIILVRDI